MKNNIIFLSVLLLFNPICIYASTPTFTSEAEIDAYFDNQKKETREYYEGKINDAYKQRDMELAENRKWFEDKTVEIYKKYLGENLTWEMIGKYFPKNNPNPEEVYEDILHNPTVGGISKQKIVYFVNTDLYEKIGAINKERMARSNIEMEKIKKEIAKYNISSNTDIKKIEDTKKDEAVKNLTSIEDKIITNTDTITINNEEVVKKEPEVKLKWYQKIFKWFKK